MDYILADEHLIINLKEKFNIEALNQPNEKKLVELRKKLYESTTTNESLVRAGEVTGSFKTPSSLINFIFLS